VDHDFAILSPEKAILSFRLAGLGSRILAHIVDLLLLAAVQIGLVFTVTLLEMLLGDLAVALYAVVGAFFPFLYFILFEWLWNGQTLGKKACGLRVQMEDGTAITFPAALARNLLRIADFLPVLYFAGFLCIFTNPKSQRLGDLAARTIVIHSPRTNVIVTTAPHVVGIHPFEEQIGDLRGMTLAEYDALRRLCDRFPELAPEIQVRLLKEVWEPIAQRRKVERIPHVHPLYLAEAMVMKYGRQHGLI
jgi:uncharacterized RDD family membrane protein YckC